jgi:hypothetical protein
MNKRILLNLVLLIIVAVLVLVVVFEPGKEPAKQEPNLTSLKKEQVNRIDIKRAGKQDVHFEKSNDVWQMTAPYQLPANEYRIGSILRLVESKSHSQHDIRQLNKADFDLEKPKVVVTFNDGVSIAFGGNEPLKHQRYVLIGNTLHLVSDTVYYHVNGKPTALVSLQLLPKNISIKAIELPDRKIELKAGRWQVDKEPNEMASDAVTRLLNEWKLVQALDVTEAQHKPGKQQIKIFTEAQAEPIVFSIVQRKPDFILLRKDKGIEYQLTEDSAERLLQLAKPEPPPEADPGHTTDKKK